MVAIQKEEVGGDGVAVITIINPPVNSLALDLLYSLKESYEQALRRDDVKAIVVTGAARVFLANFSLFTVESPKPGFISVEILTDTVEAARKPSVAAIDGLALGGGLEVAMACHARISTPNAQLGLPELQLGILPGFGTQRLPRLVGLAKSLEMMLTSKPVKGEEAVNLGLVDAVVPSNQLLDTARKWALDILECRKPWIASLHKTDKIEPLGEAKEILKFARVQTRRQAPNLQHPLVVIDVVEEGIVSGPHAGLWKEAEAFQGLLHSDTCKALVNVFFAQRGTTKVPGVTDLGLKPRRIKKVAILGGGLMGSGIATALLLSNYPVMLKEVNDKFLQAGLGRVKVERSLKKLSLLKGALDYEGFRDVDMVIEAVIENVSLKQQIFADLEKYCPPHCILASNTSTIDLDLIGVKTKSQDRIIGAHFFSPAHVMPLLEIVRTEKTSPQVIVDLLDVGKKIRKTPVVVGNCTGFAVNRMFFPYTQDALLLVERGTDVFRIDRVITKFGMPMGPFRLCDLVGFGVAIATGGQFVMNFPERTYKSMLIPLMQEDKRAGETTRRGFYMAKLSDKDIIEMIFFPVVNEACRVLAEGIAVKASDLDISAIMGMGFPPYRGGIIFWADTLGSKYVCSILDEWSRMYGDFFKPCSYLAERAAKGAHLHILDYSNQSLGHRFIETHPSLFDARVLQQIQPSRSCKISNAREHSSVRSFVFFLTLKRILVISSLFIILKALFFHSSTISREKKKEEIVVVEENESPNEASFNNKVARSKSVGCGSRSFSGDLFEKISTGFGDCTLRRIKSQRENKPRFSSVHHKERVNCGGILSYLVSSEVNNMNGRSHHISNGRSKNWGWALASPMRAFSKTSSSEKKEDSNNKNSTPNLDATPSLLTVRS
ncbi:hypothetical protein RND71_005152 [Anisodus tanguticus]|uniref:3-hydroxyacyl-CoA dehydrogenase n=1 Tax=Anisodus tanguticus TaxID=243964 RepID=A0AAE1SQX6_9SOLA|nr:hypothetical protein RND71_005152 [Anisodus tanguticus]